MTSNMIALTRAAVRPSDPASRARSARPERRRRQSHERVRPKRRKPAAFLDSVGEKVEADRDLRRRGHTHFFANGDGVKKYAAGLRAEMERRRLSFSPINWL